MPFVNVGLPQRELRGTLLLCLLLQSGNGKFYKYVCTEKKSPFSFVKPFDWIILDIQLCYMCTWLFYCSTHCMRMMLNVQRKKYLLKPRRTEILSILALLFSLYTHQFPLE